MVDYAPDLVADGLGSQCVRTAIYANCIDQRCLGNSDLLVRFAIVSIDSSIGRYLSQFMLAPFAMLSTGDHDTIFVCMNLLYEAHLFILGEYRGTCTIKRPKVNVKESDFQELRRPDRFRWLHSMVVIGSIAQSYIPKDMRHASVLTKFPK